jgi:dTDP-4-amino-4,6-dideoxygalactose transaminase
MIPITRPFLPRKEDYLRYIDNIWQRNWLTNNGPLVNELELKLKDYLGLKHLLFVASGTVALQLAIKTLGLKGEIITTPFSYIATTSSILWEGCEPVFVDIDPKTLNMDPSKIEEAITGETSAIIATHVYGNPCSIEEIEAIAKQHDLKVIFDAAHCFGTNYKGQSAYSYGDISTASFHATKIFHTVEGGAVITKDPDLLKEMAFKRNFGHHGPNDFWSVGINGKNSEFHAAMGLCNLRFADALIERRRELSQLYDQRLRKLAITRPEVRDIVDYNYAYYPIIYPSEDLLLKAKQLLETNWIYPRRYFHPVLSQLKFVKKKHMPVAEDIARRVLCLPLYHDLTSDELDFVARILLRAQNF